VRHHGEHHQIILIPKIFLKLLIFKKVFLDKLKPLTPFRLPLDGGGKGGGGADYGVGFSEDDPMKPPGGFLNPFGGAFLNRFFR
jgi:hypothetical protein